MKDNKKIIAAQLDLARQMESLSFIESFIDTIQEAGYNTLMLYLEGRIKTAGFDCMDNSEAYDTAEMKRIVDFAAARNIDVIPCISLHGHGELFLKHSQLKEFSELRNQRTGRWGNHENSDFCPSHKSFKKFFEQYLTQICKIFSSKYFHIGLDEVWNIGCCDLCKEKDKPYLVEQKIYLENVKYWHKFLSLAGKRLMMWDDMFEYYPDILKKIPQNIIMVHWQYQEDMRHSRGHLINLVESDMLQEYDRLGFDYLIAPSDYSTSNIRTSAIYAEKFPPSGTLVTSWTKKNCFYYRSFPAIVYGGYLLNGVDDEKAMEAAAMQIFGISDKILIQALRNFTETPRLSRDDSLSKKSLLCSSFWGLDYKALENNKTLKDIFTDYIHLIKNEVGKRVIRSIIQALYYKNVEFELKILTQRAIDNGCFSSADLLEYKKILLKINNLGQKQAELWEKYRNNISPNIIEQKYRDLVETLDDFPKEFNSKAKLRIRFSLPNQYGVPCLILKLLEKGRWHEIAQGTFRSYNNKDAIYEHVFLTSIKTPEAINIEYRGYGGLGICYAELHDGKVKYVPSVTLSCSGEFSDPDYFIDNDCKYCFGGNQDIRQTFQNRESADISSSCEWKMIPKT